MPTAPLPTISNMRPKQFEALRESFGLTQALLARMLGVQDRTVRRWAAGEPVPIPVALTLRLMSLHGVAPSEAYKLATGRVFERRKR